MMELEDIKTVGFKQMHQLQIDALVDYIAVAINCAAALKDKEVLADVEADSDELIKLFGGKGLHVVVTGEGFTYREIDE
tara:strand:+ start:2411 stop:2647 length:237 start_codon:yes stop_codon:yes gene_type:complete